MPRRPRTAPREKSDGEKFVANAASGSKVQLPLPKAAFKRKLITVDSEHELDEEGSEGEESSSDEDEDSEGGDSDDISLGGYSDGDREESDVDVDAPRVVQWIDEEELEELGMPPADAPPGKAEDIVRAAPVFPKF